MRYNAYNPHNAHNTYDTIPHAIHCTEPSTDVRTGISHGTYGNRGIARDATNVRNYSNGTEGCPLYNIACIYTTPYNL